MPYNSFTDRNIKKMKLITYTLRVIIKESTPPNINVDVVGLKDGEVRSKADSSHSNR